MGNIFLEITFIISLAAILSLIFRVLKQPAILAYILTGIIIGPFGNFQLQSVDVLRTMGEFGITLLLFMIGLELRLDDLKSIGKVAIVGGMFQVLITGILSYFISSFLGFSQIASFYISAALTFSSTVIVVKLLSDRKDTHSLYGKLSVGILLLQDFCAVFLLMILSGFTSQAVDLSDFFLIIIKAAVLFITVFYLSRSILPKLVDIVARSSETLFLFSIAFALSMSAFVTSIGFSIEIGGFLAGLALANSYENFQILARAKVLRDFFITIFFVILGMSMSFDRVGHILFYSLILSVFVLIIKPLIVMAILGASGYRKRTSFLSGIALSQISEFSLILIFLGQKLGHVSGGVVSVITLVAIFTFTISTYEVINGNKLYIFFGKYINFFERQSAKKDEISSDSLDNLKDHIVLVGGDQMGESILNVLGKEKVVVIDFDPSVAKKLKEGKSHHLFGDIGDLEIRERARLDSAKLVVSTIPDVEDSLLLLKDIKDRNKKAKVVVTALDSHDAKVLYKEGADYVILPNLAGGRHIADILSSVSLEKIGELRVKDLPYLH